VNLNSLAKYSILNNYPNEIKKFLKNNLTIFIDDGDLNKLRNIQVYISSLNSSSTSNDNNNNDNNNYDFGVKGEFWQNFSYYSIH
jgi:hypothetical protein